MWARVANAGSNKALVEATKTHMIQLDMSKGSRNYGALLEAVGEAQVVMIGEASHGTADFYRERAIITQQLIQERGFKAVAVESDWPDAYRVNRFLHGVSTRDRTAIESLDSFRRFPIWMWRNTEVVDFLNWCKNYNSNRSLENQVSFYGMDLYSLYTSAHAVIKYLEKVDPNAASRARQNYSSFMRFGDDTQAYGYSATMGLTPACEAGCMRVLQDMLHRSAEYLKRDGYVAQDELFFNVQNAKVVKNAEEYYRAMFSSRDISWNLRDQHMVQTLDALIQHQERVFGTPKPKVVVWAHNSHLGDARFTEMSLRKEWNVGQLVRERWGDSNCFNIGFTTHTGTVIATDNWDQQHDMAGKRVNPSMQGTWENVFHTASEQTGIREFYMIFQQNIGGEKQPTSQEVSKIFSQSLLERAIGVIYRPQTEMMSHYFKAQLSKQFDAVIHIDTSTALKPLDRTFDPTFEDETVPETYPEGV